jgi:hypothetical protein
MCSRAPPEVVYTGDAGWDNGGNLSQEGFLIEAAVRPSIESRLTIEQ